MSTQHNVPELATVTLPDLPEESLIVIVHHITFPFYKKLLKGFELPSSLAVVPLLAGTCKAFNAMFMQDAIWKVRVAHIDFDSNHTFLFDLSAVHADHSFSRYVITTSLPAADLL